MAGLSSVSHPNDLCPTSYDTALCIIPDPSICDHINQLRELFYKGYGTWPAHINLIYPFVSPEKLPEVQKCIQETLDNELNQSEPLTAKFDKAGYFVHNSHSTIFLSEDTTSKSSSIESLRRLICCALGYDAPTSKLHLTIGQSEDNSKASQDFLLAKARLLPALSFEIGALAILTRHRAARNDAVHHMKLWGEINTPSSDTIWKPRALGDYIHSNILAASNSGVEDVIEADKWASTDSEPFSCGTSPGQTFTFNSHLNEWSVCSGQDRNCMEVRSLTVSSYNLLLDSHFPLAGDRGQLVLQNILSASATADILVLQEVSDYFLSFLLSDPEIRQKYPFTSHGPPCQANIGPLPSLRNVVILSQFVFQWNLLSFQRKHKSALIAQFPGLTKPSDAGPKDLVVAGVHLTCGLTDGSVAAKRSQIRTLTTHFNKFYYNNPWIIAGDFNIVTSRHTIDMAVKSKHICLQTEAALASIESTLDQAEVRDAWSVACIEGTEGDSLIHDESLYDGEQGATFDPIGNILAAAVSGTSSNRPQRYDRILFRSYDMLQIDRFDYFGLLRNVDNFQVVASDHFGVRAKFNVLKDMREAQKTSVVALEQPRIEPKRTQPSLSELVDLEMILASHVMLPNEEQIAQRNDAFMLFKQTLIGIAEIPLILVPVGSYAMGTWTAQSDIDCLCIGTISPRTFFKLARQRLLKAEDKGVRILRRVEASTGTMLELSVHGVAMDLQYCPAAAIVEKWAEFRHLPSSDPIFNLRLQSLHKLKPYRDLLYMQRTLPSLPTFRLAYRCIKLWAIQKGLYSSRFGYLSGIHITLMLSWIYKNIAHDAGSISATDLVVSFFSYYSGFDWKNNLLYDAFFHTAKPKYHRSAREPMVLLGFHTPNTNVAHTSTMPGLRVLVQELKSMDQQLSTPNMTWQKLFACSSIPPGVSASSSALEFLKTHDSFIKIYIKFWGRTLAKGKSLLGWVESRCLSLVVDVHNAFPGMSIRIWPARFTDSEPTDAADTKDYHGCYLIGLSWTTNMTMSMNKDDRHLARQSLNRITDQFIKNLKKNEENYDPNICWIGASIARPADLKKMRLDDQEWGDYFPEMEPDSDDEQVDESFENSDTPPIYRTIPQRPKSTSSPISSSKLRPASDVLNRLRWDPGLDPSDYIIGYEDRFLGAMETNLEKWRSEQTDKEFIPQHRILYFKRRGNLGGGDDARSEEIIWERATRIDKVFWSGANADKDEG